MANFPRDVSLLEKIFSDILVSISGAAESITSFGPKSVIYEKGGLREENYCTNGATVMVSGDFRFTTTKNGSGAEVPNLDKYLEYYSCSSYLYFKV